MYITKNKTFSLNNWLNESKQNETIFNALKNKEYNILISFNPSNEAIKYEAINKTTNTATPNYLFIEILPTGLATSPENALYAYIYDIEHAYDVIDGKWLNQDKYITIHKIASKYNNKGIGGFIIKYVIDRCKNEGIYNIKIDTHKNNLSMNKFLTNKGFINCGVISLTLDFNDEYSLRNAYQLVIR